jgi:hypothetical protein
MCAIGRLWQACGPFHQVPSSAQAA